MPPPQPRKHLLELEVAAAPPPVEDMQGCLLPSDLVLEIVARSDAATIVRSAACCKPLRREILRPAFIRRVCHGPGAVVPPCLVGFLDLISRLRRSYWPADQPVLTASFSLAHPATPAAASLSKNHIAPFLRRRIAGADANLLAYRDYVPLTWRHGLVLLLGGMSRIPGLDLCVYDPMDIKCTFLPGPTPAISSTFFYDYRFVFLTAADGVTSSCSSFLLLAFDFSGLEERSHSIIVRTFSSDGSAWSPAALVSHQCPPDLYYDSMRPSSGVAAVVLDGGHIYWLMYGPTKGYCIFTYNVLTEKAGWIELPAEVPAESRHFHGKLHLASWPSGRLSLLAADDDKISVWLLLSSGSRRRSAAGWQRHAVVDLWGRAYTVTIVSSGERSGVVVLHLVPLHYFPEDADGLVLLDLETKEMRAVKYFNYGFLYEVDMFSRLSRMKIF